ncbi:hypothetical protein KCP71_11890 [Salmonella enterica subsp. enterica]|nr:hypothetical protein KCP71_11890 [Salmonella enterica subsp. enterica]
MRFHRRCIAITPCCAGRGTSAQHTVSSAFLSKGWTRKYVIRPFTLCGDADGDAFRWFLLSRGMTELLAIWLRWPA